MEDGMFLFPGQGSQVVGMGKDLVDYSDFARKTFKMADDILGYHFSRICFEGPEDELKLTSNTQPALLTVSYILYVLAEREPSLAAGHSLGEYSAYVCAGALSFEDAVLLVHKRGKYMQQAVPIGRGAMAALIGADIDVARDILSEVDGVVNLANWNSAAQIVISGEKSAVEAAVEQIAAPKSVYLPVSAPFHSQLMLPAEEKLAIDLDLTEFQNPGFTVINNVDVSEISSGDKARDGLKRQVSRPVLWHETMKKALLERGVRAFTEIGSGRVLSGLIRRTAKEMGLEISLNGLHGISDIQQLKTD